MGVLFGTYASAKDHAPGLGHRSAHRNSMLNINLRSPVIRAQPKQASMLAPWHG
jgi:hypothetical protein